MGAKWLPVFGFLNFFSSKTNKPELDDAKSRLITEALLNEADSLFDENKFAEIYELLLPSKEIIQEVDEKKITKTKIARRHGILKSTLFTILKMREEIVNAVQKEGHNVKVKNLKGTHANLEQAMLEWLSQHRTQNVPINRPMMQSKADKFSLRLGIENLSVQTVVIANCFRHTHFGLPINRETLVYVLSASAEDPDDPSPVDANSQPGPSTELQPGSSTAPTSTPLTFIRPCDEETWLSLAPDCMYEDYVAADDDITVWGALDNSDIIREQQESSDEEGEEEMEEEPEDIPHHERCSDSHGCQLKST
uniref:HTH CENPB-type domain-containing protein n=1 Tax=Timema douglasi TaxID=61478 RepID=A0A7R8Z747_TIMDO|nr:unnamed protein product [Timema douglasi]